ncbi:MAG TPA: pilus assembly protein TadG-related protein [Candidatus Binataceae bacterium]|nr:pilus assembly protein TadG-related protein [Candidatus Binataceae bacterium]
MSHPTKIPKRSQRAQILVLLAMSMPVLIGAMAMSADVGVLYFNWQALQTAADSGAVAGASYLPSNPAQAISTANSYVSKNGIRAGEITSTTVSSDHNSLNIQLQRKVPYSFALLLGLVTGTVSAQATAQIQTVGSATGVTPVAIDYRQPYLAGQTVALTEGQVGPGNWGPLALGATGASVFQQNVEYGYQGSTAVGDWLATETGQMAGPTSSAFNFRINEGLSQDPGGTFSSHTLSDPRVLIVPMVNFSGINGSSQVPVMGFAALWLVSANNQNNIVTYFISQVAAGSKPVAGDNNYGVYQAVLIQ